MPDQVRPISNEDLLEAGVTAIGSWRAQGSGPIQNSTPLHGQFSGFLD